MKRLIYTAAGLGAAAIVLPKFLNVLGLHPYYKVPHYDLRGKKALIITTSTGVMGPRKKLTGVYGAEMTIPYYAFFDSGMTVDLASIKGGKIPIEPYSIRYPLMTPEDKRFTKDQVFINKVANAPSIEEVDFLDYDLIFIAGGWGAAYDLGQSEILGEKITEAYADGKVLGAVCHGPLGFIQAKDENGEPLVKGKMMTAVTNKQIHELRVTFTPMHPELELRKRGADFLCEHGIQDVFATLVVEDGRIITGQNQNSGAEVADKMMRQLIDL